MTAFLTELVPEEKRFKKNLDYFSKRFRMADLVGAPDTNFTTANLRRLGVEGWRRKDGFDDFPNLVMKNSKAIGIRQFVTFLKGPLV